MDDAAYVPIPFDNSYARLPDRFHARLAPTPVSSPRLIALNHPLASELGLDIDHLTGPEGAQILSGNLIPPVPNRLPRPMPGTSSAAGFRSLATGGRSCWARWWTGRANAAISS